MAVLAKINRVMMPPLGAALVALGLFWLMWQLIAMQAEPPQLPDDLDSISLDLVQPDPETQQEDSSDSAPSAEQAIEQAQDVPQPVPTIPISNVANAKVSLPAFNAGPADLSMDLSVSGGFSGSAFAVAGAGSGSGSGGGGKGFSGKKLVPVSTGRPQFPKYAYDRGISGWVEVVFVVDKDGQVRNPRILDANPKGIFEEAAILSVLSWQYDRKTMAGQAREVRQRLDFKPEDFFGNWR